MLLWAKPTALLAQQLTSQAPPQEVLVDGPDLPVAQLLPGEDTGAPLTIESDLQSKVGEHYVLDGRVVLTLRDRRVEADHIEYDGATSDLTATGHLRASGGANHEEIRASHGTLNLRTQVGHFYDVTGSVGVRLTGQTKVYVSANPFLFSGRELIKLGPESYEVIGGTVTSCRLPRPDWLLSAGEFHVQDGQARARNSVFRLLNVPVLFLPYVTHPVDEETRESGLLIPTVGQSSTKGLVLGEQFYLALSRSADLTVGADYFSLRGWLDSVTFRYRGTGQDFVRSHYSQLFDRGYTPAGGTYTNQGGEDLTFSGRHDVDQATRLVADIEYLSSYVYREAFTENFNQAVSTDIVSTAYGVHAAGPFTAAFEADRYQGLKQVEVGGTPTLGNSGEQIRIFHVPTLRLDATEHALASTGLQWSLDTSASGLKRVQPDFVTNGITERVDVHPELAYPFQAGGWRVRPSAGVEETFYSRSREAQTLPNAAPVEVSSTLNRADADLAIEARAPVLERTFHSDLLERLARGEVKHTIEPEVTYRYRKGINNFLSVLRFDDRDVVADTNEVEYGVTQHLYVRGSTGKACGDASAPAETPIAADDASGNLETPAVNCSTHDWAEWRLTQKRFLNTTFGGALVTARRNIFDTTLDLSGVAFLTEPRSLSPLISRLRVRGSQAVDVEWDFDLDIGAKKFTANNVLVDLHKGSGFAGLSYARLNAPGRSYVEGVSSLTSNFNQMRVLLGYGSPTKRGLSVGANVGLDLNKTQVQYATLESSYNWDCCGFAVEYRKYELGPVRNENAYRFNFTLANIGSAGNLRRAERLF